MRPRCKLDSEMSFDETPGCSQDRGAWCLDCARRFGYGDELVAGASVSLVLSCLRSQLSSFDPPVDDPFVVTLF